MRAMANYENGGLKLRLEDCGEQAEQIEAAYYQKEEGGFVKEFRGEFTNVNRIMENFVELMPKAFGKSEWENALLQLAKICKENDVTWFLTGSACDAVRGIDIWPHDLDIEIYSKDWDKAQEVFAQYIVEPFIETRGWARDYFGRIVLSNTLIDMVADERYDYPNYAYEPFDWKGYTLWLEPFGERYLTEKQRRRKERVEQFEKYLKVKMGSAVTHLPFKK